MEVIYDWDVERMLALLRGYLDRIRCQSGCPTELPSRIVFCARTEAFYAQQEDAIWGYLFCTEDLHTHLEDIVHPVGVVYVPENLMAGTFATVDLLKETVAELMARRIEPIWDLLTSGSGLRDWRALTVDRFIALKLASEGVLPQFELEDGDEEAIGVRQWAVWVLMCSDWADDKKGLPPTFEADLNVYVDGSPVIGDALARLSADIAKDKQEGRVSQNYLYCARAVEATLYRQADMDIPVDLELAGYRRAGLFVPDDFDWAHAYLDLEIRLRPTRRGRSLEERIRVSEERARHTVSAIGLGAFLEVRIAALAMEINVPGAPRLTGTDLLERLRTATDRAGHDHLFRQLYLRFSAVAPDGDQLGYLLDILESSQDLALEVMSHHTWWPIAQRGRHDELAAVSRALAVATNPIQASLVMGGVYDTARHPVAWLAELDQVPETHNAVALTDLTIQRARALCLAGRATEAVALLAELDPAPDYPYPHKITIAEAVAACSAGRPDHALSILEPLWDELRPGNLPTLTVDYASVCFALGRYDLAIAALRLGHEHAWANASPEAPLIRVQLMYALARQSGDGTVEFLEFENKQWVQAAEQSVTTRETPTDPIVDLHLALVHLERIRWHPDASPLAGEDVVFGRLPQLADAATERGDFFIHLQALRALALREEFRERRQSDHWTEITSLAGGYGVDPPVECFVRPGVWSVAAGDFAAALAWFTLADQQLSRSVGRLTDFENAATVELVRVEDLNEIRRSLVERNEPAAFEVLRSVNELVRDPTRRMFDRRLGGQQDIAELTARVTTRVCVLELAENVLLLTVLNVGEAPRTEVLMALDDSSHALAARLNTRIANWTLSRPGDPLDVPAWQDFAAALTNALSARLTDQDHVVLIESPDLPRLPWQLVIAPTWSFSYAPSWGSILRPAPDAVARPAVGVVCVPRFGEGPATHDALLASVDRCREDAAGLPFHATVAEEADATSTVALLEASDYCTLLCHGLVDAAGASVALLLSADGRRPIGASDAAATEQGLAHRFGWREASGVTQAPQVIFSAACSSGLNHGWGGQQVGLFSALRRQGLRTLIAPRWDIFAEQVLPVLDRCRASIIARHPPAASLRSACIEAETTGVPRWLAWSLALEGDW